MAPFPGRPHFLFSLREEFVARFVSSTHTSNFCTLHGRITHFLPGLRPGVRCTCSFLPFLGNSHFLSLRPPGFRTHCSLFLQGLILTGLCPPALRCPLLLFTRGGPSTWGGLRRGFTLLHSSL